MPQTTTDWGGLALCDWKTAVELHWAGNVTRNLSYVPKIRSSSFQEWYNSRRICIMIFKYIHVFNNLYWHITLHMYLQSNPDVCDEEKHKIRKVLNDYNNKHPLNNRSTGWFLNEENSVAATARSFWIQKLNVMSGVVWRASEPNLERIGQHLWKENNFHQNPIWQMGDMETPSYSASQRESELYRSMI